MSSIIVQQGDPPVHPILADTLAPLIAKWETAALRVAANHVNSSKFSVPTGLNNDTTEALLAEHFQYLPAAKQTAAGTRSELALSSRKTRGNFTPLLDIARLNNAKSVDIRLTNPQPRQISAPEVQQIITDVAKDTALPKRVSRARPSQWGTLRLDLIRIVCIDETDGFLGSEAGEDEIHMMGTVLDSASNVTTIPPFYIADFDDGTSHDYKPPKKVVSFPLNAATVYPKGFFVTLILVEKDNGNLNDTLNSIIDKLAKEADDWLAAAIIGAVGAATGGIVGLAIAAAVTYAVGKFVAFLKRVWEDDLFDPVTLSVALPNAAATLDVPSMVFHFKGIGDYAVRYQWKLSKPNLQLPPLEPGKVLTLKTPTRGQGVQVAKKAPDMITR